MSRVGEWAGGAAANYAMVIYGHLSAACCMLVCVLFADRVWLNDGMPFYMVLLMKTMCAAARK